MTVFDWNHREVPEYYNSMYLDGYKPYEIMQAARKKTMQQYNERMAELEEM